MVDVAVESAQGVRGGPDGEVHRGEFAFGVRLGKPLPPPSPIGRELTDIVGIHDCIVLRETN